MASRAFDRETVLDIAVNIIPMAIILLFLVAVFVVAPLGRSGTLLVKLGVFGLHAVPFVVLAVVTYLAAQAISLDELLVEREADAAVDRHRVETGSEADEESRLEETGATDGELEGTAAGETEAGAGEPQEEAETEPAEAAETESAEGTGASDSGRTDPAPEDPERGTEDAP